MNIFCIFLGFIYSSRSYIRFCFQLVAFFRERIWHKALLMGYSVRLELTRVCSLNGFSVCYGFIWKSLLSFFSEYVYLSQLYPSLFFDIWYVFVVVCVRVYVGVFQTLGTAIGTKMASTYTTLTLEYLEENPYEILGKRNTAMPEKENLRNHRKNI